MAQTGHRREISFEFKTLL